MPVTPSNRVCDRQAPRGERVDAARGVGMSRYNTTDFARAVEALSKPFAGLNFEQAEANRLLSRAVRVECTHCDDDGCFAGKTKRRKCKRWELYT